MKVFLKGGSVIGRDHAIDQRNAQDSFGLLHTSIGGIPLIAGVVADGCSEGKKSEVGAHLVTQFVLNSIRTHAALVQTEQIPPLVYSRVKAYLSSLVNLQGFVTPGEEVDFIKNHLLFTLVGFVIVGQQGVVFTSGDGVLVINDWVHVIDVGNKPSYIAYHLIDKRYLRTPASAIEDSFNVLTLDLANLTHLAVGSDGWANNTNLIEQVWGGIENPRSLERQMRAWQNKSKVFRDDATLITLELIADSTELTNNISSPE